MNILTRREDGAIAMDEDLDSALTKAIMGNALTDDEVGLAVRQAFTFLASCVAGEIAEISVGERIAEISVGERIAAANALLQYATRRPDLLTDLMNTVGLVGEGDVAAVASVLE
jgi:hypothetical protein